MLAYVNKLTRNYAKLAWTKFTCLWYQWVDVLWAQCPWLDSNLGAHNFYMNTNIIRSKNYAMWEDPVHMAEIGPNSSFVTLIRTVLRLYGHAVVGSVSYWDQMYVSLVIQENLNCFLIGLWLILSQVVYDKLVSRSVYTYLHKHVHSFLEVGMRMYTSSSCCLGGEGFRFEITCVCKEQWWYTMESCRCHIIDFNAKLTINKSKDQASSSVILSYAIK